MGRNEDVAWAAGFIDGEGSLLIRKFNTTTRGKYNVTIQVTQETREPLDKLVNIFGGIVARHRSYDKYYYRYRLNAAHVEAALNEMLPHLTVKRDQALLIVNEFRPLITKVGGRQTDENLAKMDFLWHRIREIRKEAKENA